MGDLALADEWEEKARTKQLPSTRTEIGAGGELISPAFAIRSQPSIVGSKYESTYFSKCSEAITLGGATVTCCASRAAAAAASIASPQRHPARHSAARPT
jgi:hypothetical protein